jgi:hypothetical protein
VLSFLTDPASKMIYPLLAAFLTAILGASPQALGIIESIAESTWELLWPLRSAPASRVSVASCCRSWRILAGSQIQKLWQAVPLGAEQPAEMTGCMLA